MHLTVWSMILSDVQTCDPRQNLGLYIGKGTLFQVLNVIKKKNSQDPFRRKYFICTYCAKIILPCTFICCFDQVSASSSKEESGYLIDYIEQLSSQHRKHAIYSIFMKFIIHS
jgi:hypothetical protein